LINFTFVPKDNRIITDFEAIQQRVLEDLAFHSPELEWDSEEEVIKTEAIFKEASLELQEQAVAFRVESIIRDNYLNALERVTT